MVLAALKNPQIEIIAQLTAIRNNLHILLGFIVRNHVHMYSNIVSVYHIVLLIVPRHPAVYKIQSINH